MVFGVKVVCKVVQWHGNDKLASTLSWARTLNSPYEYVGNADAERPLQSAGVYESTWRNDINQTTHD